MVQDHGIFKDNGMVKGDGTIKRQYACKWPRNGKSLINKKRLMICEGVVEQWSVA
jgi:hypothetical protein